MQSGAIGTDFPQGRIAAEEYSKSKPNSVAIRGKSQVLREIGEAKQLSWSASVVIGKVKIVAICVSELSSVRRPCSAKSGDIAQTAARPGGQRHNPIGVFRFGTNVILCQQFRVIG